MWMNGSRSAQVDAGERAADREALALEAARRGGDRADRAVGGGGSAAGMRGRARTSSTVTAGMSPPTSGRRAAIPGPLPGRDHLGESVARMTDRVEGTAGSVPDLVAVVLAAGAGTRLRPLTDVRPKALCTVGGRPLLDLALERVAPHVGRTAVNAHHHADQLCAALAGRDVHVEVESPRRSARPGRWATCAAGWTAPLCCSPTRTRTTRSRRWSPGSSTAGTASGPGCSASPAACPACSAASGTSAARCCPGGRSATWHPEPSGLYEVSWRALHAAGRLDLWVPPGLLAVDCGTPADYLRANLVASGGSRRRARGRRPGRAGPLGGLGGGAGRPRGAPGGRGPRSRGHAAAAGADGPGDTSAG